jgi:hypothetical protein
MQTYFSVAINAYRNIVADAQKRFWLPYFKSIVAQWGTTPERKACNARYLRWDKSKSITTRITFKKG